MDQFSHGRGRGEQAHLPYLESSSLCIRLRGKFIAACLIVVPTTNSSSASSGIKKEITFSQRPQDLQR